jgi:hypothetical protein
MLAIHRLDSDMAVTETRFPTYNPV